MAMKRLKKEGKLDDQEESDEINACSIVPVRPPKRIIISPGSEVSLCTARLGAAPITAPISMRFAT